MIEGNRNIAACIVFFALLGGCGLQQKPFLFSKLEQEYTGIDFNNQITSSDTLNIQNYPFMFNGGGVAIGDINNDGLADLYLTGNMVSSRLYLNKGNMQFEDITGSAGVGTDQWASGVSMGDVNADGYLDIYVSVVSPEGVEPQKRANLLFINNGDTKFTESAADYNLDYTGFTIHSAFLDYDRDGDLDLFLLNHSPGSFARNQAARMPNQLFGQTSISLDKLFRNEGNGSFTEVSRQAGLSREEGFGLGVAVSDINRDGWPDIYVSNDILPDDVLYINNRDGTFLDKSDEMLKHTSFAGMGVDIADFNNDGWPDIFQVDMMPEELNARKRMSGGISYSHYRDMREKGFYYQYSINTLQLSNGLNRDGEVLFSEIGRLAGVAYTDWSWSALFGDYDNDGLKDLMVTNGFPKAINNYDYLTEMNNALQFGTAKARRQRSLEILEALRDIKVPNYIFRNEGNLDFSDQTEAWGFDESAFAFGASQGDLDNDGDLDIVINNINSPASIYRNEADTLRGHHYLSVELEDTSSKNTGGIGARIKVTTGSRRQYQYVSPYRGYQSSTDSRAHFGLGGFRQIDTLEVIWPDGRRQVRTNIAADQQLTLRYSESVDQDLSGSALAYVPQDRLFTEILRKLNLTYRHQENDYNDYTVQGLLPYQYSRLGPPMAAGDVNGDGLDDIFIGGAAGQPGSLFVQTEEGTFEKVEENGPWIAEQEFEDVGATFFDADEDGDQDLYVASGGYEFSPASDMLQDRLYFNTGVGKFVRNTEVLPRMLTSSGCVKPADFDGDGDIDLFICGRVVPRRYPYPAKSYLLQNEGGTFTDVTDRIAPGLVEPGLITDATWSDFDGDGQLDLVTTGEWLPVRFYKNDNGSFTDITESLGLTNQRGWWFSLEQADFDNDGDPDFIAGNLGLNYSYQANDEQKFEVYASDFDKNQSLDLMFSVLRKSVHYPYYGKAKLGMYIPSINKKFNTYQQFSEATVEEVVGTRPAEQAFYRQVDTFASVYIENLEGKGFTVSRLPVEVQLSSVNDMISTDLNGDGNLDMVLAGNMFNTEPQTARNDASNGAVLLGDGKGGFLPVSPFESGLMTPRDVKSLELIDTRNGKILLVGNNDDSLQLFKINNNDVMEE